jgi:hypothetical protein
MKTVHHAASKGSRRPHAKAYPFSSGGSCARDSVVYIKSLSHYLVVPRAIALETESSDREGFSSSKNWSMPGSKMSINFLKNMLQKPLDSMPMSRKVRRENARRGRSACSINQAIDGIAEEASLTSMLPLAALPN